MCYDLLCGYQDHMGDCMIANHDRFKELYGWPACTMGEGGPQDPDDEEIMKELRRNLVFQYMQKVASHNRYATYLSKPKALGDDT